MLEWGAPLWFLALPLAVLAPWLRRGASFRWTSLSAVDARMTVRSALAWTPRALGSLGLCLLVIALARPQEVDRERFVENEGIDILLVLDTSGSMKTEDYNLGGRSASRITVAKEVIAEFVEGRPNDRIGLVIFGEEAFTQVPLTRDHEALIDILRQVRIGMAGDSETAIGDGIGVAAKRLTRLDAPSKVAILLTDGRNNAGRVSPFQAAEAAEALDIKVYTVGIGSSGGGRGGIFGMFAGGRADLDERTLKAIATMTDAEYFRAGDTEGLVRVYERINELETSTAEVREFVHTNELYRSFAAWGLAMLLLQVLLGETLFRRLP